MVDFVHLHVYSEYSLLQGMNRMTDLIRKGTQLQMPGVAVTDDSNMFGAMELYTCVQQHNHLHNSRFKGIIGMKVNLKGTENPCYPLVFLARNLEGYHHLVKLSSIAATKRDTSPSSKRLNAIEWKDLETYGKHLICLSGGMQGELAQLIVKGTEDKVLEDIIGRYKDFFGGDHFYLEVQNHHYAEEKKVRERLKTLGQKMGVSLVATNEVHYLTRDDKYAHEVLLRIDSKRDTSDGERKGQIKHFSLKGEGYHLKSYEEMLMDFDGDQEVLTNTVRVAEMCEVSLPKEEIHYPYYELPEGQNDDEFLGQECLARLEQLNIDDISLYKDRLTYELGIIKKMGFASYFLVVADFVNAAKQLEILVGPGRGSAVGSLVAYVMGITGVDPLKYGLLFERFLNPERVSLPDVDIDFQRERREEVIQYCRKKYGSTHVAQVITYGKLKAKAVFKDVARVFGVDFKVANKVSSCISGAKSLREAYEQNSVFKDIIDGDVLLKNVYRYALKLEGIKRQTSVHASGVIIADKPVDHYVPLTLDEDGNVLTQYEGELLEKHCGLIKMDFLGLKTLSIIEDCRKMVWVHRKIKVDLDKIPFEDENTYKMLSCGHSLGIFQFESEGMRKYLKELKPSSIEDLTAMNAMYRPGPMEWIPVYIAKKHGRKVQLQDTEKQANFEHLERLLKKYACLREVLSATNGIPIYQEQIMEIGKLYAGFSLGKADLMRRAMGKKKKEELDQVAQEFIEGAKKKGYDGKDANFLFQKIIMPFAGYGFNKSHAVCYAFIAYQTAYLKANYTAEFMVSLLNSELDDTKKIRTHLAEALSLNVEVKGVDINMSLSKFHLAEGRIVYGLQALKGVGNRISESIVNERKHNGPYSSFVNFLRRQGTTCNKLCLENLIKAGSFNVFSDGVSSLLGGFGPMLEAITKENLIKEASQVTLFERTQDEQGAEKALGGFLIEKEDTLSDLQKYEVEALGFLFLQDILSRYRDDFQKHSHVDLVDKTRWRNQQKVKVVMLLERTRVVRTKKNEEMAFITLKNHTGSCDGVLFPGVYKSLRKAVTQADKPLLEGGALVWVEGSLQNQHSRQSLLVDKMTEHLRTSEDLKKDFCIEIEEAYVTEEELQNLKEVLKKATRENGHYRVVLFFQGTDNKRVKIHPKEPIRIQATENLTQILESKTFVKKVWVA